MERNLRERKGKYRKGREGLSDIERKRKGKYRKRREGLCDF